MDILTGNIKRLYCKYLAASVMGAVVMSIYSFVDMIAIGQSEGPIGTAAMAVITPFFGIMVFISIICEVGGAVLMGNAKGEGNEEKGNACFTAAMILIGGTILRKTMSMIIALLRSMVISVLLLYLLPLFLGILGVWLAMPISELIVAAIALIYITKINWSLVEHNM